MLWLVWVIVVFSGCGPPGGDDPVDTGPGWDLDIGDGGPPAGPRGLLIAQTWGEEEYAFGPGAGGYSAILLQESMYPLLDDMREANPEASLFAYQSMGAIFAGGGEHSNSGVGLDEADAHESWFLHDRDGNRLRYCDYEELWAANVGDAGYRERWLDTVRERVTRDGYDGVLVNDANTTPGHCLGVRGTPVAEYPSDADYGDAAVAFLAEVGPALQDEGLAVAANIGMDPWDADELAHATAMLPSITHWGRAYWMRWDDSGNFTGGEWEATLATLRIAQEAGVGYLASTAGPGAEGAVEGQRYGRASWLLGWDGASDSAWGYRADGVDPWGEDWEPDLGLPLEDARLVEGAWVRRYGRGIVVVNPEAEGAVEVPLGATYFDPELGLVQSITLGAGRGRILEIP